MSLKVVIIVLILLHLPAFYRHYGACYAHHYTNRNLINSPQCADLVLRARYGYLQEKICKTAHEELHIAPWMCAIENIGQDWTQLLHEYHWSFLGMFAVAMFLAARSAVQVYNRNQDRKMFQAIYGESKALTRVF